MPKNMFLTILLTSTLLFAEMQNDPKVPKKIYSEQDWGIGYVSRWAQIPYISDEQTITTVEPLFYFENEFFFLNGLEAGLKLYESDDWRLSAITRFRFVDMPEQYQNELQADTHDIGIQGRYKIDKDQFIDLEVMNDLDGRAYSNIRYSTDLENGSLDYNPYVQLQWKSANFNSYYYGLNQEDVSADLSTSIGVDLKYHVISNFYLIARLEATYLGKEVGQSTYIEDDIKAEGFFGFGFFNDKDKELKEKLDMSPYLRLAHGWATPSNLDEILTGRMEKDPYNNQMTSLFYGYPLTDEFFSLPLKIYLTPGLVFHHDSEVQDTINEYVIAMKLYYTLPIPWGIRLGIAEGLSYANRVTYIEKIEMEEKGYKPSKLLNYLDFSVDLHLGDIFGKNLDQLWLGYSIHHRSAMVESSSRFGRIKGGSNYNSVHLQWHF